MKLRWLTPRRLWLAILGVWALFLTGALAPIVGSPGVMQAIHLGSLLQNRQAQLAESQIEIGRLQSGADRLEKSREAQHREVRTVLGYAASDELIFDFGGSDDSL